MFKAADSEIDSSDESISKGVGAIGAPVGRRLGLSLLSFRVFFFTRYLPSGGHFLFFGTQGAGGEAETQLQRLSRSNVQELVLHEVVAPLILGAEIDEHVYATDAALSKAVVSTLVPDVAKPLWPRGVQKCRLRKA